MSIDYTDINRLNLKLPQSLLDQIYETAKRKGISIGQLMTPELIASLLTKNYLERDARGSRAKFEAALAKVPAVPSSPKDALDEGTRG